MRKRILILMAVNLIILLVAFAIAEGGHAYDTANKLYPELYQFSYDAGISVYGKRWERLAMILVLLCFLGNFLTGLIWYIKYGTKQKNFPKVTKRLIFGSGIALSMFAVGTFFSWLYPTFTYTGGIGCGDFYCLYHFQPTLSSDPDAIILFNQYGSAEKSRNTFESNLRNGNVIERKSILNETGQPIGERAIVQSSALNGKDDVTICWTDGEEFWSISAPSLRLALRFEESEAFQNALKSNKQTKPAIRGAK